MSIIISNIFISSRGSCSGTKASTTIDTITTAKVSSAARWSAPSITDITIATTPYAIVKDTTSILFSAAVYSTVSPLFAKTIATIVGGVGSDTGSGSSSYSSAGTKTINARSSKSISGSTTGNSDWIFFVGA